MMNSVMRVGFGFSNVTFRPSRVFHSRVFSYPSVDTDEQSTGSCPPFYQTFKMLTMSLYAFRAFRYFISSYYSTDGNSLISKHVGSVQSWIRFDRYARARTGVLCRAQGLKKQLIAWHAVDTTPTGSQAASDCSDDNHRQR